MANLRLVKDEVPSSSSHFSEWDKTVARMHAALEERNRFYDAMIELTRKLSERMDRTERRLEKMERKALFLKHNLK